MIAINIIAVGDLSEKWQAEACAEYVKRLGAFCKYKLINIKEGQSVLSKLTPKAFKIALCVEGEAYDSAGFADLIDSLAVRGYSELDFIIGGSDGLSGGEKAACDLRLSFSKMTFTHGMMRVFLLEQIYRAFMINKGLKYHK